MHLIVLKYVIGNTKFCMILHIKLKCKEHLLELTGRFLLLQNFSVAISVSPHICFILVLILISVFLR